MKLINGNWSIFKKVLKLHDALIILKNSKFVDEAILLLDKRLIFLYTKISIPDIPSYDFLLMVKMDIIFLKLPWNFCPFSANKSGKNKLTGF